MKILGGTIKIFQKVASSLENIDDVILGSPEKKLIFGISNYSRLKVDTFKIALEIKKRLSRKKSIRVIAGKDGLAPSGSRGDKLSSAQSYQYKLARHGIELGLFAGGIGKLIAVQDIDFWSKVDYGKPRSDARSGMLPPKLARAMVNIALGQANSKIQETPRLRSGQAITKQIPNLNIQNSKVSNLGFSASNLPPLAVVDPFCGSGNILIEALVLGLDVIGSDISEKAVEDTKANLDWLLNESGIMNYESRIGNHNSQFNIHNSILQADATKFDFGQIDRDFVVVSEPFLGQPRKHKLTIEEEKQAVSEAAKLYLDFLHNLRVTGLRVRALVLVFPLLELKNGKRLSIFDCCVDKIKKIGYILSCLPLIYGRDYQIVKREIVLLKQNNLLKNQRT